MAKATDQARPQDERDGGGGDGALHSGSIALLVVALLLGFAVLPRLFKPAESAMAGKDAPEFTLKVVANGIANDKASLALRELRGQAVILDFWATWCGPCNQEAPILDRVAQRFKDQGLVVVGVNTSDEDGNARTWAASHGITFPIVYDARNAIASVYGVQNLPTMVVVSREGKVLAVRTGVTSDRELEELVKKAL